mgnify:CR=1 FL=1
MSSFDGKFPQEPLIYINGRPYCVKHRTTPFQNLEFPGITPAQIDAMEETLRQEILAEAKRNRGRILLHGERDVANCSTLAAWGEVYSYWEPVDGTDGSVLTSRQAFEMVFREFNNKSTASAFDDASSSNSTSTTTLPSSAFAIKPAKPTHTYLRCPVPDEKSPGPKEFDIVERAVRDAVQGSQMPPPAPPADQQSDDPCAAREACTV